METLTPERRRRTQEALAQTVKFLRKELSYSLHLRNQEEIVSLNAHIAKLEEMLAA